MGELMSLLKSSKVFLIESLDNFCSKNKVAFSILHGMIALELLLKERLHRISPNLIYANIDANLDVKPSAKSDKKAFTVQLSVLPTRLKNLGVQLKKDEIELINDVADWRNNIAHHVPIHDDKAAKLKLETLYNFIFTFLVNELGENFHDFLPKEYYQRMEKIIDELNRAIAVAKQKAQTSGHPDNSHHCPVCNITGVVEVKDEDNAYCHLCIKELRTAICAKCENQLHTYAGAVIDEEYCSDCMEAARDQYIEHLIDLQRGK